MIWRSSVPPPGPSLSLSCSTPIKCIMYSGCSRCTNRGLAALTYWHAGGGGGGRWERGVAMANGAEGAKMDTAWECACN